MTGKIAVSFCRAGLQPIDDGSSIFTGESSSSWRADEETGMFARVQESTPCEFGNWVSLAPQAFGATGWRSLRQFPRLHGEGILGYPVVTGKVFLVSPSARGRHFGFPRLHGEGILAFPVVTGKAFSVSPQLRGIWWNDEMLGKLSKLDGPITSQ